MIVLVRLDIMKLAMYYVQNVQNFVQLVKEKKEIAQVVLLTPIDQDRNANAKKAIMNSQLIIKLQKGNMIKMELDLTLIVDNCRIIINK